MQSIPPIHLTARTQTQAPRSELALRYAAATAATLLAIGGAQLVVSNVFALVLVAITLVGVPVSIFLRLSAMRVGSVQLSRPLWNAFTVLVTFAVGAVLIYDSVAELVWSLLNNASRSELIVNFGPERLVMVLIQVFLLFAAFRSFALLSDKDATLSTVPSFSVLLLLIPVHKGIEVVCYFLAWTVVATVLFALDHRSEGRAAVTAYVPPAAPGQGMRLAARSLATILGVSLLCAAGISYFLTSRDVGERSKSEAAISDLAARLTRFALSIPELSSSGGPERQIDFSSSPTLPTRTELWQVNARVAGGEVLRPDYWRMFTLAVYDGKSWAQGIEVNRRVKRTQLNATTWPARNRFRKPDENSFLLPPGGRYPGGRYPGGRYPGGNWFFDADGEDSRNYNRGNPERSPERSAQRNAQRDNGVRPERIPRGLAFFPSDSDTPPQGFRVRDVMPTANFQDGAPSMTVRQIITSVLPTTGFVPVLPSVRAIQIGTERNDIRVRGDGGIDLGVMKAGDWLRAVSDVPQVAEYGFSHRPAPLRRLSAAQIKASKAVLTASQRRHLLQLPKSLPRRVRAYGNEVLSRVSSGESNLRRAQRLALAIQQNATYTLHPPTVPEGRDATDFFLFDGARRGYCTYFAGALTVLCRTQGIPARVVSGFIDTHESRGDSVMFREANLHSWTEIWVEGWGWAVVDATPADDRGQNAPTWIENWQDWMAKAWARLQTSAHKRSSLVFSVAVLLPLALVWRGGGVAKWRNRWRRSPVNDDGERRLIIETYRRASAQMNRKFRPRAPWETPDEWLQGAASLLSSTDSEALRRLTALYTAALYTQRPLPPGSGALAKRTADSVVWKKMRA